MRSLCALVVLLLVQVMTFSGVLAADATPTELSARPPGTLFVASFSQEELPSGTAEATFYRLTLPAGGSLPYLAGPFCGCGGQTISPGVGVEMVISGQYGVRSETPFRVIRGGKEEDVPAGFEVVLTAGEVGVFPSYSAAGVYRNAGDGETIVVGVAILSTDVDSGTPVPTMPEGVRAEQLSMASSNEWAELPPGPIDIRLERATLAAGESWPAAEVEGLQTIYVETGSIGFRYFPADQEDPGVNFLNAGAGRTTAFNAVGNDVRRVLDSTGNEAATLLVLTITSDSEGAATPAA
jgi:hypothetical protein